MDRTLVVAAVGAAATVLVLLFAYGPIITAFIVASSSFALMLAVMMVRGVTLLEGWRHSHHWTLHRTKTH
jgi:hypothetical protein